MGQMLLRVRYSRYCSTTTTRPGFSFALYIRPFSSFLPESTAPVPVTNDPDPNRRTPVSIQPISYAVKKPENPPLPAASESPAQGAAPQFPSRPPPETHDGSGDGIRPENTQVWTRDDFRFVKDVPNISPVSYPSRVALLPEDRVGTEKGKEDDGRNVGQEGNDELERERWRIDAENRNMMMTAFNIQEEKVPFPTLIRTEQARKKEKLVYDLKEAILFIKVGFLVFVWGFNL